MANKRAQKQNRVTPMEIHNKEFKHRGPKGYDAYEVDSFLDDIIDDYGDTLDENVDLKNENYSLKQKLEEANSEKTKLTSQLADLQKQNETLATKEHKAEIEKAELDRESQAILDQARDEAAKIVSQAKQTAESENSAKQQEVFELDAAYQRLKQEFAEYREKAKKMLEQQLVILNDANLDRPVAETKPADLSAKKVDSLPHNDVNSNQVNAKASTKTSLEKPTDTVKSAKLEDPSNVTIVFPDDYKDN